MKEGQTIALVRDSESPARSINTKLVSAAIASGIPPASENFYLDTVEDTETGPKRQVTWQMDASKPFAHFRPNFPEEKIDFLEFRERFNSREWCEANADHPIAYLRAFVDTNNRLVDKIKTLRPMLLIRKGKRVAIVPSGNAPEDIKRREEILGEF